MGDMQWVKSNLQGLSTVECLDFILDIPQSIRLFGYSFNYDLTKILQDLDNRSLYRLFRPEIRQRPAKSKTRTPYMVPWEGYRLNLQGTKFTVQKGDKQRVVWDIFKFYQSKYVQALDDWKIGDAKMRAEMTRMKELRSDFANLDYDEILAYCLEECRYLGQLAHKLVIAHSHAGIDLKTFYGAGSTASAMLKAWGIGDKRRTGPDEMREAVACAFFGGRFEHSVIGPIQGPVYSFDISSAYPYQICFLPCLKHGTWELTKDRFQIETAKAALVRYSLSKIDGPWSPFPFREKAGTIVFPSQSGGGWIWRDEYLVGERLFPKSVHFHEAWIYKCSCSCRPFKKIPAFYKQRLRIGKEGPGIVIKLGCNSVYGKLAQSVGEPPYQSWIWAGMITSGCRAQLLTMLELHKDWNNLLAIATDGIYTREDIKPPEPFDTGTSDALDEFGKPANKPLGGWERKPVDKGVFFARPGIYFPLLPTEEELKKVRARGIGRAAMFASWKLMVDAWAQGEETIKLTTGLTRFCGAKSCVSVRAGDAASESARLAYDRQREKTRLIEYVRADVYGEWIPRPIELSLNPLPKRHPYVKRVGDYGTLSLRAMPLDQTSCPYDPAMLSPEGRELRAAQLEALEQPDGGDFEELDII